MTKSLNFFYKSKRCIRCFIEEELSSEIKGITYLYIKPIKKNDIDIYIEGGEDKKILQVIEDVKSEIKDYFFQERTVSVNILRYKY